MKKSLITMQPYFVFGTDQFIQYRCFRNGISHMYAFKADPEAEAGNLIIPDGCINILFGYDEKGMDAKVYGTMRSPQVFVPGKREYFGIRLYQDEFMSLMNCSPEEIAGSAADLDSIPMIRSYRQQLSMAGNFTQRVQVLQSFMEKELPCSPDHKEELLQQIKSSILENGGRESVGEIEAQFHYSARYINRIFQEKMALSVKEYSEIVHLQRILFRIKEHSYTSLTDLAMEEGYYDQAHFTRKFREYTHMTPLEYGRKMLTTCFKEKIIEIM